MECQSRSPSASPAHNDVIMSCGTPSSTLSRASPSASSCNFRVNAGGSSSCNSNNITNRYNATLPSPAASPTASLPAASPTASPFPASPTASPFSAASPITGACAASGSLFTKETGFTKLQLAFLVPSVLLFALALFARTGFLPWGSFRDEDDDPWEHRHTLRSVTWFCVISYGLGVIWYIVSTINQMEGLPPQPPGIAVAGSKKLMPAVGFSLCDRSTAQGLRLIEATKSYLQNGGRLIDTAQGHGNTLDVAVAIREGIREARLSRDDVWITSKVQVRSCIATRAGAVRAVQTSLGELYQQRLDLVLLDGGSSPITTDEQATLLWLGLLDAKRKGLVGSVGVSNMKQSDIERLIATTGVAPAVVQLEFHPWSSNETKELVSWCKSRGIAVSAYNTLGRAGMTAGNRGRTLSQLVKVYENEKGPTQVLLRWALDQGVAVTAGAATDDQICEILDLEGFNLRAEDAKLLESCDSA
eukprot:TRINITY_DN81390_c0_g1_i1.p1 TRINITY_DN81390_c0_g1~~TRINITY_DN81390_c0_g1_i1.p1  ORF type:complete len:489 (+),score=84.09 TRINITY_DN81390_c0_g1_i1:46-1467(+)